MNESIVRESLQRLRDQKRQNSDVIREAHNTNSNRQAITDQLSIQYEQEECQRRKMQEALRLSVSEQNCITGELKKIMQVTEDMKILLEKVAQQGEDLAAHSMQQMRLWETECRKLALEFQQGYKLYLSQIAVKDDQRKLEELCRELERTLRRTNKEEQLISTENSNIDEISSFLQLDLASAQVFEVFPVNQGNTDALRLEVKSLKEVEIELLSKVSNCA